MAVSSISGLCHVNNNNNNTKSPLICPHGLIGVGNYRNNNSSSSSRKRNRVRVCSSSSSSSSRINKDLLLEARWILNDVKTASTSSSSIKDKEQDEKEEEIEKKNYYVNTGNAIRTLRQDFPDLFYRDDLSFDIYRDDIVFKDPLNTFFGIHNYKTIFWALRFNGRIFFKALWVDIISVSQPVETTIMIRWTVHGIPRVPWETRGRFDATSEYKLDKNGMIYQHRVHNIALNAPPRFQVLSVNELIQSLGCPSTPKPTYFEISSSQYLASLSESKMESSSAYKN